jgi:hypothetical protein
MIASVSTKAMKANHTMPRGETVGSGLRSMMGAPSGFQDQRSLLTLMMKIKGPGVVRGFLFIARLHPNSQAHSPHRTN